MPLRLGARPIGLLAAAGRPIERATLDAVAGLAAIAIERAQFLDDRKAADLARQGEALKSALLASLGHDLRTPLTAIRVAASNLQASWPDERERREQSDLILTEVDRLTRLFQNILEMARIDAGAVTEDTRWVAPSEIVEAARASVEHALRGRTVDGVGRCRSAGPARSAADRRGAVAPARERRAVFAAAARRSTSRQRGREEI